MLCMLCNVFVVTCVQNAANEDASVEAATADLPPDVFIQVATHLVSSALRKCIYCVKFRD